MKLRLLKKSIHRRKHYKHWPRYLDKIQGRYDKDFDYYTCGKLSARYCAETNELVYIIKSNDNDKADN